MKIKTTNTSDNRKKKLRFLLENEIDLFCVKHKKVLSYFDIDTKKCYQDKAFKSTYCLNLRGYGDEDEFSKRE
ncbi:MAG TPA: hypothetical protein ENG87_02475 [Candidatus Pacearchaeota archaeon]|nr:hypothetical protein BMS3Abin17_00616 [archaeon BMS3Abin17]HDK42220.1 hypothetical protein [Candidatus Pacearchaeota archaeon]HDZ60189.1 hypothetical protein [Candidatus Pacearchaeota archaeon]